MYHVFDGNFGAPMYGINILLLGIYFGLFLLLEKPDLGSVVQKVMNR
jgi:hypothetical protein